SAAIGFDQFTQSRSHGDAFLEASYDTLRQGNLDLLFAPLPLACFIGEAEAQGSSTKLKIKSKAVGLSFRTPIVPRGGQQPDAEQGNALHLLVGRGERASCEEVVTRLLDHILHRDVCRVVIRKLLLQSFDSLFDTLAVFPCGSLLIFGANEAIGEDGLN